MKDLYFNTLHLGRLYMNKIYFSYESEPILFLLLDNSNRLYFCNCFEIRDRYEWLISRITNSQLLKLVQKEITIRDLILSSDYVLYLSDAQEIILNSIEERMLPEKGVYLNGIYSAIN